MIIIICSALEISGEESMLRGHLDLAFGTESLDIQLSLNAVVIFE